MIKWEINAPSNTSLKDLDKMLALKNTKAKVGNRDLNLSLNLEQIQL